MSITAWAIAVQIAERRVASPEVVEHELHAAGLEVAQCLVQPLGVLEQHALGQLQLQHVGVGAGLAQHLVDQPVKRAVARLHRRDVDRH
jgi:hypothetical protein